MKNNNLALAGGTRIRETRQEGISWLFTHFLYVLNEKIFKFDI